MTRERHIIDTRCLAMLKFICEHPWKTSSNMLVHYGGHARSLARMMDAEYIRMDERSGMLYPTEKGRGVCMTLEEVSREMGDEEWKDIFDRIVGGLSGAL